jgi:type I restriction enzyme, S subunit
MSTIALKLEDADTSAWTPTTLGEVCQINPGKPKVDTLPADAPVTFVPMAAVDEVSGSILSPELREFASVRGSYTAFQEGDVLFAKITPCMENGKAAIARDLVNGLGFGSTEFHVLRPSESVLPEFIYQLVRQKSFRAEARDNMTGSVGQARVPTEWLKSFQFDLPPIETQRQIVELVSQLQEQMESTSDRLDAIPALVKKFRQSVLAAACSGQLTADWRGTDELTDWDEDQAQSVCARVQSGSTPREGFQNVPGIPFLKVYNLVDQIISFDYKPQFVSNTVAESTSMKRSTALPGDVLMNIVGPPLGKVAIVTSQFQEWTFNQALTLFRPSKRVSSEWIYLVLCSGLPYEEILMQTRGSAGQSNISLTQCREMVLPIPPLVEQAEIVRRVESLLALADSIESRLADATVQVERTTQAILSKAFRGEL